MASAWLFDQPWRDHQAEIAVSARPLAGAEVLGNIEGGTATA